LAGKFILGNKEKKLLRVINKLLKTRNLLTSPSNVLPLHLKQIFLPVIPIFTKGEDDGIKTMLPFKIFSTLTNLLEKANKTLMTPAKPLK
jgi:hypothetical protein